MRPIFHRHYRPLNPLKFHSLNPQILILHTLVSTRSLSLEKFQSIPSLLKSSISSLSLSRIRNSWIWLRKQRRKRLSSRSQKPSPYALTTVDLQAIRPPTTCARSASTPPPQPPPQQPPELWRVATRCTVERAQTQDPGPPSEPTLRPRPARIGRRILPQSRWWRRSGRSRGRWIGALDVGGRSASPDSVAGAETCSAPSIGTQIATCAATITRPPVARLSRGKIRSLKLQRSWESERHRAKKNSKKICKIWRSSLFISISFPSSLRDYAL